MKAVFKREFFSSFNRLYGYISVAVLTLFSAILFIFYNLSYASEDITSMLSAMVVVSALVIPVIAIGVFPSAKKVNTDELYDIMPISTKDVVLGKYFAAFATVMLPTLLLAVFPAIAGFFGEVDHCASYSALIGFLLFQAAWLSVCIFIAKVAKNQLRAYVWCYCIGILWYFSSILSVLVPTTRIATLIGLIALIALIAVILYISTKKLYVSVAALAILGIALAISFIFAPHKFAGLFEVIIGKLSIFWRYNGFTLGVFDIEAIIFYLSLTCIFVFLTWQRYERRFDDAYDRYDISFKKLTSLGLALAITVGVSVVNIGAAALPDKLLSFDATMANKNSVSKEAKAFISGIDKEITIYLLESTENNGYELYLEELAASNKKLNIQKIYYADSPEFYLQRGISKDSITANSLVIECGDNSQYLSYLNLFYYSNSQLGATNMSYTDYNYYYSLFMSNEQYAEYLYSLLYNTTMYFNADTVICTYIEYVASDIIPTNYYLVGHGEKDIYSTSNPYYSIGMSTLNLSSGHIPVDAASILINVPETDFSNSETELLLEYLENGGQLTFITNSDNMQMKNLCAILKAYGMSATSHIVNQVESSADSEGEEDATQTVSEFVPIIHTDNDVMYYLDQLSGISFTVKDANAIVTDADARNNITHISLLSSDESSFIDESTSSIDGYTLACAAETPNGAKVVWFTAGDSFNDASSDAPTAVVVALNWVTLVFKSAVPNIPAAVYATPSVEITSGSSGLISILLIATPLCIAGYGTVAYYKRKKSK